MRGLLPLRHQLANYSWSAARGDLVAGLTLVALLVPQSMAYAMLAGLPPITGLYAATFPVFAYALFGTSRYLSVGPVALLSVVLAAELAPLAEPGSADYVVLCLTAGFVMGWVQIAMGLCRLGTFVDFLSRPVIVGFAAGAAIVIASHQLPSLLGLDVGQQTYLHTLYWALLSRLTEVPPVTLGVSAIALSLLLLLRFTLPRWPRALMAVAAGTALVYWLDPTGARVEVVGAIPAGLPQLTWPDLSLARLEQLMPIAALGMVVGFIEAFAVATVVAEGEGESVQPDRELVGLGAANIVSSLCGGSPVGGAFSRTAVNVRAGARSIVSVLLAAVGVLLTLMVLTPLLRTLPIAVLSAVIVVAVLGLVDIEAMRHLFRADRREFSIMLLTLGATLIFGVGVGVAVGVVLAVAVFIRRASKLVLHRVDDLSHPEASSGPPLDAMVPHVVVLKPVAPLFFGNARRLRELLHKRLDEHAAEDERDEPASVVVVDGSAVWYMDATAQRMLEDLERALQDRGVELHLAELQAGPLRLMERTGFAERLGKGRLHRTLKDAIKAHRRAA